MIYSMTGYAAGTIDCGSVTLSLELKSVNSRFLDLHFRIPEELRLYEMPLRELIVARVTRGKLECRLNYAASSARQSKQEINRDLLGRLKDLQTQVQSEFPQSNGLSVSDVLRWPGMLGDETVDFSRLGTQVNAIAKTTLDEFCASRGREGEKLADMILDRAQAMRNAVNTVAPRIPEAQALFQEKLRQRLIDAIGSADDERIRQEVAVFANRIDVAEEVSRLMTHLDEVERVVKHGGACGKRLDFLMQELNREANTLGSKSAVTEVSQTAMELKLLIEQIREQVQNLE